MTTVTDAAFAPFGHRVFPCLGQTPEKGRAGGHGRKRSQPWSGQGHAGGRHRWRLAVSFALVGSFFVVELVYGLLSGSLALLSDAGHMAADVVTLGAALVATRIATRPDTTGRRTYGSYRAEVFASLLAVLLMLGVAVYVVRRGRRPDRRRRRGRLRADARRGRPRPGRSTWSRCCCCARGAAESLNVKGAYLEVVADTAGSVGVIAAGLAGGRDRPAVWDTLVALPSGSFVAVRAVSLGRQVFAVLGQHVPAGIDPAAVADDLAAVDGVRDVHDLHLWTLTSGMNVATAHLVTADRADRHAVLDQARDLLRDRHGVAHATLQVEPADHVGCDELGW